MDPVAGVEGETRFHPKLWDYNCILMRRLALALSGLLERHVSGVSTTIDFGCGTRLYEKLVAKFSERYLGADPPDNPLADLHIAADGRVPVEAGSCGLILSSEVLEHIIDVDSYLKGCAKLLRPGGFLLLSTHGMWTYHPYPIDVRRWTRWGLEYEIKTRGFEIAEKVACLGPSAYTAQLRLQLVRGALYQLGVLGGCLSAPLSLFAQGLMWIEDAITPGDVHRNNAAVYVVLARR